jgi:hypothetical protein
MNLLRLPILACLAAALPLVTAGCGAPLALTAVSYGADGVSVATTNKTGTDHLISMASKKDCALWRMFRNNPICKDRPDGHDPYDVDYTTPERVVSEQGVEYLSPPRPPADAPASSWDAAAYKPAPALPTPPVVEPVTAVAGAAPGADVAPVAAQPRKIAAFPKKKAAKPKVASAKVRKPSPDQVASRL